MKPDEPHYLGHRKRLRNRFIKSGLEGFAEHEVIELLLTLAIPRKDVKKPAKGLLEHFGNLRGVLDAPIEELQKIEGIGIVTPVALRIIREIANLYLQQKAETEMSFSCPETLYEFWRAKLGGVRDEVFEVAYLDSAYRLLRNGVERMEEGTIDRATVYPRRIMEAALRRGAAALIFSHNHPNEDLKPTEQDKVLTRALVLVATTLQIKVLDHLIVSKDAIFSFRKEGLL